jgi:serine/threonine-protein kinase
MSGTPHDANATMDLSPGEPSLCEQFEAAWEQALKGGPPPAVDSFLALAPEAERPTLRGELTRIDSAYRPRHAQLCSLAAAAVLAAESLTPTGPPPSATSTITVLPQPPAGPEHTIDQPPDAVAGDATTAPPTPSDTAVHVPNQTIGYAAPADPAMTIDPEAAAASATNDLVAVQRGALRPGQRRTAQEVPRVAGYEILGELGRGGMGVVYKARHVKLNRLVALKMVLAGAHAGESDLARFYTEAEAVAQLQHANIVQIYEIGEYDGLPYFSLEYVNGGSLGGKLAGQPQPPREAARMVETLSLAMAYAHLHGIIHRDLKPGNVLMTKEGQPKISDFGLAKKLEGDAGQTRSGTLMGTPNYMAPEQARGDTKEVGPLADVYALGVILYQMLTGRTPFIGTSILDTLQQVQTQEPVPPSRLQPKVPADLETITLKCLQKEPHKRYGSADALAADLHRFLAGEPIQARPIGNVERLWRWCQRNPRVAVLSAAVLALLVTVAIGSTVMAIRIKLEHDQAVAARELADQKARDEEAARNLADQNAEEARQAQQKADANAKVASDQRKLALETLYKLVTKVEEKLRDRTDMHDIRQDILTTAMDGLNQVSRSAETAATADRSMGVAHQRMGDIFLLMGRTAEGQRQYLLSLPIFERLMVDDPQEDWNRWNAALSHDKLGDIRRQMGSSEAVARDHYLKALALREGLVAQPRSGGPAALLRKQALAISYAKLGSLAQMAGDPAGARDQYVKALKLSEELMAAQPKIIPFRQSLAGSYFILGDVSFHLRDAAGARTYFQKALEQRQKLAAENQQSVKARLDVATTYAQLGDVDLHLGQPGRALESYQKAHELYEGLAQKDRQNSEIQSALSTSFYRLATARLFLKDIPGADRDYGESLRLRAALAKADPANASHKVGLMLVQARLGQHAEAARLAEELSKQGANDAGLLFRAACGYALAVAGVTHGKVAEQITPADNELQQRYADAAVATLSRAVEQGYNDVVALELDPDLRPLLAYPNYQQLLKRVQEKSQATAAAQQP